MAPPTLVHSRADIQKQYEKQFADPKKYQCSLRSLTQQECTFIVSDNRVQETLCIPFKRVFQRCLIPYTRKIEGKKQTVERWVNIEVTDTDTNESLRKQRYGFEVKRFLTAEQELHRWMESAREES